MRQISKNPVLVLYNAKFQTSDRIRALEARFCQSIHVCLKMSNFDKKPLFGIYKASLYERGFL